MSKRKKGNHPPKAKTPLNRFLSSAKRIVDSRLGKVTLAILAVLAFVIPLWTPVKNWIEPISVEPDSISLGQLPWQIKTNFFVRNDSGDKTLFGVWVMISLDDCSIKSNYISITTPDSEEALVETLGNISADFTCVRFDGTNKKGKQIIFMLIHHLVANETRPFTIKVSCFNDAIVGKRPQLSISVVGHSSVPTNLISSSSELTYTFTLPIPVNVKSISLYLKRTN